ncbi:MAG TPA: LamG-like jellyroll fold domain-containing protein [Planctomycetota bacterium]
MAWSLGLLAAVGAGAAPAAVQQVGTVPIPNLSAYWSFDELGGTTAADGSGNGNTGTHIGPVVISTSVPPFPGGGRSLQFAQTGGTSVDVPSSASLQMTGSFTLAAWVFANDGVEQHGILEKWNQTVPTGGYFLRLNSSEYLGLNIVPAAGGVQGISTAPRVIPLGQWVHVAGVFNSSGGTAALYVNGVADATTGSGLPAPGAESNPFRIGRDYGGNGFNGNIDEPRVYSKPLTAGEIGVLMTGQAPPGAPFVNPGVGTADLNWTAPPAVAGVTVVYAVKRSTTPFGPYTVVATGIPTTSYTDTGLGLGQTYYYVVSAVSVLESVDSPEGSATTLNPIPRTKDHQEGLFDDNCACGSTIPFGPAPWAALALLAAFRRRIR